MGWTGRCEGKQLGCWGMLDTCGSRVVQRVVGPSLFGSCGYELGQLYFTLTLARTFLVNDMAEHQDEDGARVR